MLRELDVMRVIDREQAQVVAGFHSIRRANDRLLNLTRAGLLNRVFTGTVATGQKAVYLLSPKGAALVDAKLPGLAMRKSPFGPSPLLLHRLAINDIYLTLKYRALPQPEMRFQRWIGFREALTPAIPLTPDGYAEIAANDGERALFLEVDLGTEPLSVWQRKVQLYLQLALSGGFETLFRQPQFRVLVITTSERRLSGIRGVAAKFTDRIFRLTTFDQIRQHGFWSAIWHKSTGDQRLALF
ncbi:MAG: replication-relaxation family protein [Bryobacteraceae bacterium]|nr:replication-relaxation family protein [Bryobacteraceae bacterium]